MRKVKESRTRRPRTVNKNKQNNNQNYEKDCPFDPCASRPSAGGRAEQYRERQEGRREGAPRHGRPQRRRQGRFLDQFRQEDAGGLQRPRQGIRQRPVQGTAQRPGPEAQAHGSHATGRDLRRKALLREREPLFQRPERPAPLYRGEEQGLRRCARAGFRCLQEGL